MLNELFKILFVVSVVAKKFAEPSAILFTAGPFQIWRPYPNKVVSRLFGGHSLQTIAIFMKGRKFPEYGNASMIHESTISDCDRHQ